MQAASSPGALGDPLQSTPRVMEITHVMEITLPSATFSIFPPLVQFGFAELRSPMGRADGGPTAASQAVGANRLVIQS